MKWMRSNNKELLRKKDIADQLRRTKSEFQRELEQLFGKSELDEFKKFAFQGQMVNMAIAFILGAAFRNLVSSISNCVIMPIINYILLQTGDDWRKFAWEPINGISLEFGKLTGAFVDFLIISIILYVVYRKFMLPIIEDVKKEKIKCVELRECPMCYSKINYRCTRCPQCTVKINNE